MRAEPGTHPHCPEAWSNECLHLRFVRLRIALHGLDATLRVSVWTTKARHPEIPWRDIKDMRNKLIHDYGHVDPQLVWAVVQDELPALGGQICRVIRDCSDFMPDG